MNSKNSNFAFGWGPLVLPRWRRAGRQHLAILHLTLAYLSIGAAAFGASEFSASRDLVGLHHWWAEFTHNQRSGLVVWHRGAIVAEWYDGGFSSDALFEIGSLRKSFNSALIGVKGVDVNTNAYAVWPEIYSLTNQEKDKAITLHQLVSSTSGWKTERGPGEEFLYNNAAFTAAERVVARILKLPRDETAPEVERLFKARLGATSWRFYHWEKPFSPADRSTGPKLAVDSNLRDLLRWGVLWHNRGENNGEQLIPVAWVVRATSIVNPHLTWPRYGYNWFVNADGLLWPGAPRDAFGHYGSGTFLPEENKSRAFLLVCPSLELVCASIVATDGMPEDYFEASAPSAVEFVVRVTHLFGDRKTAVQSPAKTP
jgi:hypothetical protein